MEPDTVARVVEPFDKARHERKDFSCGVDSLDQFFRTRSSQDSRKTLTAVFVLAAGSTVLGYYTLSAYTIEPGELPEDVARKFPSYPKLPATLIGRLAVDRRYQGQGLGEVLLMDALRLALSNTATVGSIAVVVEAENEKAQSFYLSYGFISFPNQPGKLFLPMRTIKHLHL